MRPDPSKMGKPYLPPPRDAMRGTVTPDYNESSRGLVRTMLGSGQGPRSPDRGFPSIPVMTQVESKRGRRQEFGLFLMIVGAVAGDFPRRKRRRFDPLQGGSALPNARLARCKRQCNLHGS